MNNQDDNHEEESFFVSMTDIMVGLLFIFILIIMYFAVQAKIDAKSIEKNEAQIAQLTTLLDGQDELEKYSRLTVYQSRVALQRNYLLDWVRAHLERSGVDGVEVIEEQGVIRLPEGILFDSGEFQFGDGSTAEATARAISRALSDVLKCSVLSSDGRPYKGAEECRTTFYHNKNMGFVQSIYIEGHTDSIQISGSVNGDPNITTNLKLSARRSTNTFETITDESPDVIAFHGPVLGDSDLRFEPILASAAYGEWRPVSSNDTKEGRRSNRRIDLRLVMYVPPNIDAMRQLTELVGGMIMEDQ
jgi:flagellar motor protein MotB